MTTSENFRHDFTESHAIEHRYKWTLYNFSSCNKSTGDSVKSEIFSSCEPNFENVKWKIKLYPQGDTEESKKFVSIFLQCISVDSIDVEIPLDWEIIVSTSSKPVYKESKLNHIFTRKEADWGFTQFMDRVTLLNNLTKGDDTLTIMCKMLFNKPQIRSHLNLSKDVGLLLEMEKLSDVILISNDGIEHKAHKAILSCRSKVFSAMFEYDMKENQENVVKIEDIDSDTLKEMLQFIYTGEIKNSQTKFKELFVVADKYDLNDLKDICIRKLNENINVDNVLDLFEFAQSHNIIVQKLKLAEYFLENKKQIMSTKGFEYIRNLSRESIEKLLYISATDDTSVLL